MAGTEPLRATFSEEDGSPTIHAGQRWVATTNDGVAAVTIIRAADDQESAWFVETSTGQACTMTPAEISTGYRQV